MKQIISILVLSAFVGISGLSAGVDSSKSKAEQSLSKADSEFLFGANAKNLNVQVLSQKELEETKGELWPAIFWNVGTGFVGGVGWSIYDSYAANRPINWNEAFIGGLKGAGTGLVFGALGSRIR